MAERAFLERLTRDLTDQGMLIEAGWVGYRLAVGWENISREQLVDCRKTFFAGALHVFSSMMNFLDEGEDPTPADLARMDKIAAELEAFGRSLEGTRPDA